MRAVKSMEMTTQEYARYIDFINNVNKIVLNLIEQGKIRPVDGITLQEDLFELFRG